MAEPLSELFIDLTLRGSEKGKVRLDNMRAQLRDFDKAQMGSADITHRLTKGMIEQLETIKKLYQDIAKLAQEGPTAPKRPRADDDEEPRKKTRPTQGRGSSSEQFTTAATLARGFRASGGPSPNIALPNAKHPAINAAAMVGKAGQAIQGGATGMVRAGAMAMGAAGGPVGLLVAAATIVLATAISKAIEKAIDLAKGASPNAASTYEGSWKMLTNAIGRDLIPLLMSLSKVIQDAAHAYEKAKESTVAKIGWKAMEWSTEATGFPTILRGFMMLRDKIFGPAPFYTSSQHQARFMSFEEGWRSQQQIAASGGSLEAKLLQEAIKGNQIAAQSARSLGIIAGNPPPEAGNRV